MAVDPHTQGNSNGSGKRYWVDIVVSNDGTVRIERVVPAAEKQNTGAPDGITLQTH